jgi:hypothetical protein
MFPSLEPLLMKTSTALEHAGEVGLVNLTLIGRHVYRRRGSTPSLTGRGIVMSSRSGQTILRYSAVVAAFAMLAIMLPIQRAAAATTVIAQHSNSCLDVTGGPGQTNDGALIEQWHCTGALNQNWALQDASGGRIRLVAQSSSKCIEPVNGGTNTATLQQMTCNGTTGQLWFRQATTATGVYEFVHLVTGKCLNVASSSTADGTAATLSDCTGGANQKWKIAPTEDSQPLTEILVKHSGMCLDVVGGPQAIGDNKPLEQWPCSGASNESFLLKDMGSNQVQIIPSNTIAANAPKCLQPASDNLGVVQYSCSATDTKQLWKRQPGRLPGDYKLMNVASSTCLDVTSGSTTNPDPVQLATCTNSDHQNWSVGKRITLELRAGEYWGVAQKFAKKSPYGGLNQIWGTGVRWSPLTDLYWVGGTWAGLSTGLNQYNYSQIETTPSSGPTNAYRLDELSAQNKPAIIWFSVTSPTSVPSWVLTKCSNAGTPITLIKNGSTDWGYAVWEDCPRTELTRFIRGMFSKYKDDPRIAYAYATTLSSGEFYMPSGAWTDATTNHGSHNVTPAQIQTYAQAVIDAWADALGEKKIIWTSAGWPTADPNNVVSTYALQTRGMQLREGIAEGITSNITQPLIGQGLTDLTTRPSDEQNSYQQKYFAAKPKEQIGREGLDLYGDEFEKAADVFDDPDTAVHETTTYAGVFDNYEYYRMAVLNMLRKGENYAIFPEELRTTDNDATHPQFAVLRDHFRQTAGYPENEAPDGWAVLQVWYHGSYSQRRYHNYEKYVTQREVAGGGLTRAEVASEKHVWPTGMFAFSYKDDNNNTVAPAAYFSKSTDHATGNDYMYFDVDDGFINTSQYRIAVTYKDVAPATWRLEYTDTNSVTLTTASVTNPGDGTVKTAVFNVPRIAFVNGIGSNMDFRIYNGGSSDVTIMSVRVIRY